MTLCITEIWINWRIVSSFYTSFPWISLRGNQGRFIGELRMYRYWILGASLCIGSSFPVLPPWGSSAMTMPEWSSGSDRDGPASTRWRLDCRWRRIYRLGCEKAHCHRHKSTRSNWIQWRSSHEILGGARTHVIVGIFLLISHKWEFKCQINGKFKTKGVQRSPQECWCFF
jgi:hypothetical protein